MSNDDCAVCTRRVGPRAKSLTCLSCRRRLHLSCDKSITVSDLDFCKSHPASALKYLCPGCLSKIESINGTATPDVSVSTFPMRDSYQPSPTPHRPPNAVCAFGKPKRSLSPSRLLEARVLDLEKHLLAIDHKLDQVAQKPVTFPAKPTPKPSSKSPAPVTSTPSMPKKAKSKQTGGGVFQMVKPAPPKPITHSVIVTNVPESVDPKLQSLHNHDLAMWTSICSSIGLPHVEASSLTRLTRHPSSPHAHLPRLLRVDLASAQILEDVLLSRGLLRGSASDSCLPVRIYPDVPWAERERRRQPPANKAQSSKRCSIIVHGVPELGDTGATESQRKKHDCDQWLYLSQLLCLTNVVTTDVRRLPRPTTYSGSAHRLMVVSFLTADMASATLSLWYTNKRRAPPDVRFRPLRALNSQNPPGATSPNVPPLENPFALLTQSESSIPTLPICSTLDLNSDASPPKNGLQPATPRPVSK